MKKILLLGGSAQQVVAIETAKKLGYYTVLCDYLKDNPGQYVADKFYLASTTDKELMLDIAKKESIDGVIAYASDPAAPTAAYIAEKMNLAGNPFNSVEILCNKDKFREFLKKNKFNAPVSQGFSSLDDAKDKLDIFNLPVIIKPVDSSGSKGVTIVNTKDNYENALKYAFSYSRTKRIIIEEYLEKKHKYLIGGDIFVHDGKVKIWGLMNCHRDKTVNPLVPVGKSFPVELESEDYINVKETLQKLVSKLEIKNGPMNVELIVDKNNKVWPIDIGPRSGGNMIPDLLNLIFDIDVVELCIKVAMGEKISLDSDIEGKKFFATHNLHSAQNGKLKEIVFSDEIKEYVLKKNIYLKNGSDVEYFDNASKALGIVFLKFNNKNEMDKKLENINRLIQINVE